MNIITLVMILLSFVAMSVHFLFSALIRALVYVTLFVVLKTIFSSIHCHILIGFFVNMNAFIFCCVSQCSATDIPQYDTP